MWSYTRSWQTPPSPHPSLNSGKVVKGGVPEGVTVFLSYSGHRQIRCPLWLTEGLTVAWRCHSVLELLRAQTDQVPSVIDWRTDCCLKVSQCSWVTHRGHWQIRCPLLLTEGLTVAWRCHSVLELLRAQTDQVPSVIDWRTDCWPEGVTVFLSYSRHRQIRCPLWLTEGLTVAWRCHSVLELLRAQTDQVPSVIDWRTDCCLKVSQCSWVTQGTDRSGAFCDWLKDWLLPEGVTVFLSYSGHRQIRCPLLLTEGLTVALKVSQCSWVTQGTDRSGAFCDWLKDWLLPEGVTVFLSYSGHRQIRCLLWLTEGLTVALKVSQCSWVTQSTDRSGAFCYWLKDWLLPEGVTVFLSYSGHRQIRCLLLLTEGLTVALKVSQCSWVTQSTDRSGAFCYWLKDWLLPEGVTVFLSYSGHRQNRCPLLLTEGLTVAWRCHSVLELLRAQTDQVPSVIDWRTDCCLKVSQCSWVTQGTDRTGALCYWLKDWLLPEK